MSKMSFFRCLTAALLLALSPFSLAIQEVSATSEQVQQLDINHADAQAIASALDGVGLVKAREIVAYREMFGAFRSVEELLEVKGIGAATVERNRDRILISPQ